MGDVESARALQPRQVTTRTEKFLPAADSEVKHPFLIVCACRLVPIDDAAPLALMALSESVERISEPGTYLVIVSPRLVDCDQISLLLNEDSPCVGGKRIVVAISVWLWPLQFG